MQQQSTINMYISPPFTLTLVLILTLFIIFGFTQHNIIQNNTNEKVQEQRKLQLSNRINNDFTLNQYQTEANKEYYQEHIRNTILSKLKFRHISIKWENVVIMMLTHNQFNSNELVQAHFHTWINRIGDDGRGLDIVFVTDEWDLRSVDQILPYANEVKPTIHLYRSAALHMGKKCRAKVLDGFTHVVDKFKSDLNKLYFIKMDPDNFLLAENVLDYLNYLHKTDPNPVDFGRHICAGTGDFCFSEGGLYGMDRLGLLLTLEYIKTNEDVYDYDDNGKDSIEHEDFFMSYAFFKALGYSAIEGTPIIYPWDIKSCETSALSIHPIKSAANIYDFARYCYDENGDIKKDVDLSTKQY